MIYEDEDTEVLTYNDMLEIVMHSGSEEESADETDAECGKRAVSPLSSGNKVLKIKIQISGTEVLRGGKWRRKRRWMP